MRETSCLLWLLSIPWRVSDLCGHRFWKVKTVKLDEGAANIILLLCVVGNTGNFVKVQSHRFHPGSTYFCTFVIVMMHNVFWIKIIMDAQTSTQLYVSQKQYIKYNGEMAQPSLQNTTKCSVIVWEQAAPPLWFQFIMYFKYSVPREWRFIRLMLQKVVLPVT